MGSKDCKAFWKDYKKWWQRRDLPASVMSVAVCLSSAANDEYKWAEVESYDQMRRLYGLLAIAQAALKLFKNETPELRDPLLKAARECEAVKAQSSLPPKFELLLDGKLHYGLVPDLL